MSYYCFKTLLVVNNVEIEHCGQDIYWQLPLVIVNYCFNKGLSLMSVKVTYVYVINESREAMVYQIALLAARVRFPPTAYLGRVSIFR